MIKNKLKRVDVSSKNVKLEVKDGTCDEMKRKRSWRDRGKKFMSLGWKNNRKLKHQPEHSFLITMMFANGTLKRFVITTDQPTFDIKKKTYYLYYEEAWYDLSTNQYLLFYHENYATPINREIVQSGEEAFFNVTPDNLKNLIKFEYVKVLAGAHNISNQFKTLIILVVINMIISAAAVIMTLGTKPA